MYIYCKLDPTIILLSTYIQIYILMHFCNVIKYIVVSYNII